MAVVSPDMCRVTVVTPNRWADLALPAGEPLANLLPAVLDHVGDDGLDGRPLVLQRLGSDPLDEARSLLGNGVLDGETLYLNAADEHMPPLGFDDAIAGLGAGIDGLANRWSPLYTRRIVLGLAVVPLVLAWALLAVGAPRSGAAAGLGLAVSLVLCVGAALSSRAWGDRTLAVLLGVAAVGFSAAAGVLAILSLGAPRALSPEVGLATAAVVFSVAALVDVAIGGLWVGFAGCAFGATAVGAGCAVGVVARWEVPDTAALVMVLVVVAGEMLVGIASRLAGVWLPPLPRTEKELEEGVEPVPAQEALTRAAQLDQYVTGLLGGSAVVQAACVVLVGTGLWELLLVAACSLSFLLRMRVYLGQGQRVALLVGGAAGPVAWLATAGLAAQPQTLLLLVTGLVTASLALVAAAVHWPGRRTIPHLGRAAEIMEGLVAATVLPLLLAVLGTYTAARNIR